MSTHPQPGDTIEVTYRGVLVAADGDGIVISRGQLSHALPIGPHSFKIIDPDEPTTVGTIVTGWSTPNDGRPEAMYLFVLTGTDGDGDGAACWQAPGDPHEYTWQAILEPTAHGRRIIAPPPPAERKLIDA